MSAEPLLSDAQREAFRRDGVLVIPAFYDPERDILPIQAGIHRVIGQVMKRHGIADERAPFEPLRFDDGYQALIARDRSLGGEVYDAIKQLPGFIRLIAQQKNESLFREIRLGAVPGLAGGGHGIRIDNPGEERFRSLWHQEYPSQLRSLDGVVFWSPLRRVTESLGPVRFCVGSHLGGLLPVTFEEDSGGGRAGAYAQRLLEEEKVTARYPQIAPLTVPGDLVLIDFLTLHCSGSNVDRVSRWSMQFRYFNFDDPVGMSHGWQGSFAAGVDFRRIHPELSLEPGE